MTFGSPAPVFVLAVVSAVLHGDWSLARYCARYAVLARVAALLDDSEPVDVATVPEPGRRGGW